jgi:hypothetical protein
VRERERENNPFVKTTRQAQQKTSFESFIRTQSGANSSVACHVPGRIRFASRQWVENKYQEFLKNLKQVCQSLGYNENMFGTHSLRRGSVTEQFRLGIPDQVIKTSGQWKSQAFESYIVSELSQAQVDR